MCSRIHKLCTALCDAHLPPYSGAMKCMFFMLSRHVLTWWWIASGATTERKSERNRVRKCIRLCLRGRGISRSPPPTTIPLICWPIPHTKTSDGFWGQLILPTFEKNTRPFPSADRCHRWHAANPARSRFVRRFCAPENELDSRETLANHWRFMIKTLHGVSIHPGAPYYT